MATHRKFVDANIVPTEAACKNVITRYCAREGYKLVKIEDRRDTSNKWVCHLEQAKEPIYDHGALKGKPRGKDSA